jgi:uncharacterized protein
MSADTVQLKEYHLFSRDGEYYLLNIEDMTSFALDEEQFEVLNEIRDKPFVMENREKLAIYLCLLKLIRTGTQDRSDEIPNSLPLGHASINVTQECNLNCTYCFAVGGEYGSRGYMSRDTAFKSVNWLIRESGAHQDLTITFFGGEPLLNFALIKEVVDYAKALETGKKISFAIITNGTLMNEEVIEFFKKHDFCVGIGFDAVERLQNRYRPFKDGRESYPVVRKNISALLAAGVKRFHVTCQVSDDQTDFKEARQALIETGCAAMNIHRPAPPLLESKDADSMEIFATIKSGNLQEYTEKLLLSVEEEGQSWLTSIKERKFFPSRLFSEILGRLHTRMKRHYFCGAGKGMVNISISGDIYPCHRFNGLAHMKMGTLENSVAQSREKYVENHTSRIPACRHCPARYFCGAGCIYEHMAVGGGIDTPYSVWCAMMMKAVELGIAIYHKLDEQDLEYLKSMRFGSGVLPKEAPEPLDNPCRT